MQVLSALHVFTPVFWLQAGVGAALAGTPAVSCGVVAVVTAVGKAVFSVAEVVAAKNVLNKSNVKVVVAGVVFVVALEACTAAFEFDVVGAVAAVACTHEHIFDVTPKGALPRIGTTSVTVGCPEQTAVLARIAGTSSEKEAHGLLLGVNCDAANRASDWHFASQCPFAISVSLLALHVGFPFPLL